MKMILGSRMQARRDAVAGPTLASIRRDRELAPPELKPLFRYIEANPASASPPRFCSR